MLPPFRHLIERRSTVKAAPAVELYSWEEAQRELALLRANMLGAQAYVGQFARHGRLIASRAQRRFVRDIIEEQSLPYLILDPRPGLHIVDANDAFAATTSIKRSRIAGDKLFDLFPDNPEWPGADGVSNVVNSMGVAAQAGVPHVIDHQRHDIRDASGKFVERHWRLFSTPVIDENGRLIYLLFHPREVSISSAK